MRIDISMQKTVLLFLTSLFLLPLGMGAQESSAQEKPAVAASSSTFVAISDVHLDVNSPTSQYGNDSGTALWTLAQGKLKELVSGPNPPEFVIFVGDIPGHDAHEDGTLDKTELDVLMGLRKAVQNTKIPLFYVPGNNDSLTEDYGPFTDKSRNPPQGQTPLDLDPKQGWPIVNGDPQVQEPDLKFLSRGFYSALPFGKARKLKLIVLNTTIFTKRYGTPSSPTSSRTADQQQADSELQIKWLGAQLKDAQDQQQSVYLAMHVPPGLDGYSGNQMWNPDLKVQGGDKVLDAFLELVDTHKSRIKGMLTSHTHMDGVQILYNAAGQKTEVSVSVSSVSPDHLNNPSMKVLHFDRGSFELQNHTTYWTTPDATTWGGNSYSFMTDATPKGTSLFDYVTSMSTDDLRKLVQKNYAVQSLPHGSPFNPKNGWSRVFQAIEVRP